MDESKPQILVVDDVPANIQVVKAILENHDYEVVPAKSGSEALDIIESQLIDLVLLDVMMPEMNGFETASEIKKLPEKDSLPIIFLTARSEKEEVIHGFEAGGVDYVSKPFNKNELLVRVRTHLTLEKTRKTLREKNTALEKIASELREANLARDRFVSILAHDLKNPFSGLIGLIEEIIDNFSKFNEESLREIFEILHKSSNNVYNLLLTLLEWGRTQTGALVLHFKNLHIPSLIDDVLIPFRNNIELKNIRIETDLQADGLWADSATVSTVVRNLLSNAIKFTPKGGTIWLNSNVRNGHTVIEVKDTGVGIKPENIPRLFKLENKLSTPGTEKEPGTGLGLLLCKEFMEKNEGEISVESVVGQGTSFTLKFPRRQPA